MIGQGVLIFNTDAFFLKKKKTIITLGLDLRVSFYSIEYDDAV